MRQRRHRLQVSTFPFLAVLLCAMGSLILLLLVIDRRAKIVARVKAMRALEQAWSRATAEDERAAAAHRAEWERRRRLLHEQLMQEDQQTRSELQGVESKVGAAAAQMDAELASSHQLQEQLQAERSRLARFENELSVRRDEAAKTAQEANLSRADLARLTVDLERMERTLSELKALRQRQQQTYSLVPYHGNRGDNRRPLYIECTEEDLIFHPDHLALHSWALTPGGIRAEIERRLERQRAEIKRVDGKPTENGYLLMLIRPNGIATYYQTLAALRGLPIDFGYEFIDQDWILDFSENENAPKRQPWMAVEQTMEKQPSGSFAIHRQPLAPRTGRSPSVAGASGWWESSPNAKNGRGQPGVYAPLADGRNGAAGYGASAPNHQGGQPGLPSSGTGLGRPVGIRAMGSGLADNSSMATGEGPASPFATVSAGITSAFPSAAASGAGNSATAHGSAPALTDPPFTSGRMQEAGNSGSATASGQRAAIDQNAAGQMGQNSGLGGSQGTGSPGNGGKPGNDAAPSPLPSVAPTGAYGSGNGGNAGSGAPSATGGGGGGSPQGRSDSAEPLRGPPGNPLDHFAAQNPQRKPARAIPPRPGPLVGNRDWIISIECTADALVLPSSGQHIAITELAKGGSDRLLEAVQRMIARRQATVRPGEPPYRPMIRFRVRPDGLRSYYLAYPALEALHLPMSRENLDP
jgi:hypothetical protein